MKSFFSSLLILMLLLSATPAKAMMLDEFLADPENRAAYENFPEDVKAQMKENDERLKASAADTRKALPDGTISCFDHYRFGSVEVELEPVTLTPVPGSTLDFSGVVKNTNPYPIVAGTLFVKIFRQNQSTEQDAVENGYPLVDQFIAGTDIVVPAGGTAPATFAWDVPANLPGGEYYAAFYFSTHNKYNLAGIMFMDDITGNQVDFTVTDTPGVTPTVALDRNGTSLNGFEFNFSKPPRLFDRYEPVEVAVTVVNPRDEEVVTSLTWTLSPWGDLLPERMINTKTVSVTLKPKEKKIVTYVVEPHDNTASYVVAELKDGGVKSIQNIRFAREGVPETRLEFPTILKYPLVMGEENGIFTCAHSTNEPVVLGNEVTLKLTDTAGNVISSHTYTGGLTVDMAGILGKFAYAGTLKNFDLEATLTRDGKLVETVKQEYRCAELGLDDCSESPAPNPTELPPTSTGVLSYILYVAIILLGGMVVYLLARKLHHRSRQLPPFPPTLALLIIAGVTFLGAIGLVEAKSDTLTFTFHNDQYGDGSYTEVYPGSNTYRATGSGEYPSCNTGTFMAGDGTAVYSVNVINKTTGAVIADGATVAAGTPVQFVLQFDGDFNTKTVSWGSMSGCYGSPTGAFVAGAARTASTPVSINPPTINVVENSNGNTIFTCTTQTDCVIGTPGAAAARVTFGATYGRYYDDYTVETCGEGICTTDSFTRILAFPVAATSINFNFTAVVPNTAPTAPTISGPATGTTGSPATFSFTATDSDGDQVRYGIDWDNNGTVDQWAPSSGYVNSGIASSATHTWATAGTYTFRARTEDDNGGLSGWSAAKTVTVSTAPSVNLNFQ